MASNESKFNLNLKKIENPSDYLETSKNTSLNLLTNKNVLLGLFAAASISVFVLAGLAVFIYLKKSELEAKANQNSAITSQDVAGVKTNETQESSQNSKLQPDPENSTKKDPIKANSEILTQNEATSSQAKITSTDNKEIKTTKELDITKPTITLRNLTPQDFHDILLNSTFENTDQGLVKMSATDNPDADNRINTIAQSRGFQLWPQAQEDKLVEITPNVKLQPYAAQGFKDLAEAAKKDGVIISLVSGYRSQSDQIKIFKPRFEAMEMAELGGYYTGEELGQGLADDLIYKAMALTAPPGYSRHHTGYTVDLSDLSPDNTTSVFNGSKAFKWLSANNYANARKYGWIPSYPEGLKNVGPNPESWEYVWVEDKAL